MDEIIYEILIKALRNLVCQAIAKLCQHGSNKKPRMWDHVGGDETQALRRRGERQCVADKGREGVGVDELGAGEGRNMAE